MAPRVLVAGLGNIFLGDDAFGVEVAQRLSQRSLTAAAGVRVTDFGIRSYDLAYALMEDWDLAILADALPQGGPPGTVYVFEPDLRETHNLPAEGFDAHTMNPVSVLQLVSALGGTVGRVIVVGCEPQSVDPDAAGHFGLSAPVRTAVDEAIRVIEDLIARMTRATAA